jgi:retron-type reverse transcriptase
MREVLKCLEVIYERDFLECSYGFRPGRRAHDATRTVDRRCTGPPAGFDLAADPR